MTVVKKFAPDQQMAADAFAAAALRAFLKENPHVVTAMGGKELPQLCINAWKVAQEMMRHRDQYSGL